MKSSAEYRLQLRQRSQFKILSENIRSDDLRWIHQLAGPVPAAPPSLSGKLMAWVKKLGLLGRGKSAVPRDTQMALRILGEGTALKAYGSVLSTSEKLEILSGKHCVQGGFAFEPLQAKLHHRVLSNCQALCDQMLGWWGGERVGSLKQI